ISPSSSCFSFETSFTTSPLSTVPLPHLGSSRVEDTTYLGMLFSLSAHSPLRDSHREAKYSSLRRPSSRASAPSASPSSALAHSSRSLSPIRRNQPPCRKPPSPVGSWTTPSSERFSLTTIFPMLVLLGRAVSATSDVDTAAPETGLRPTAHFAPWPVSLQDRGVTRYGSGGRGSRAFARRLHRWCRPIGDALRNSRMSGWRSCEVSPSDWSSPPMAGRSIATTTDANDSIRSLPGR